MIKILFMPAIVILVATLIAASYLFFVRKDEKGAEDAVTKGGNLIAEYATWVAKAVIVFAVVVIISGGVAAAIYFGLNG